MAFTQEPGKVMISLFGIGSRSRDFTKDSNQELSTREPSIQGESNWLVVELKEFHMDLKLYG